MSTSEIVHVVANMLSLVDIPMGIKQQSLLQKSLALQEQLATYIVNLHINTRHLSTLWITKVLDLTKDKVVWCSFFILEGALTLDLLHFLSKFISTVSGPFSSD